MKQSNHFLILLLVCIMVSASLACNFRGFGRQASAETIPVSAEAADSLQEKVDDALEKLASGVGEVTLTIDEVELTSIVAFELQKVQEPQILDPQIRLRDGQIQISANLDQGNILAPIQMVIAVEAGEDGYPQYQIISAMMGPVPLPELITDQLKGMIDNVLAEKLRSRSNQVFIRRIVIADGVMIIQGEAR